MDARHVEVLVTATVAAWALAAVLVCCRLLRMLRFASRPLASEQDAACESASKSPSGLALVVQPGLVCLRWPPGGPGETFLRDYAAAAEQLAAQALPFGLVHDVTGCNLQELASVLPLNTLIADATAIASHGNVERVAVVRELSPMWRRALQTAIDLLCPVQPAAVFDDPEEARMWARRGLPRDATAGD